MILPYNKALVDHILCVLLLVKISDAHLSKYEENGALEHYHILQQNQNQKEDGQKTLL